jgi:hypothetical protein
VYGKCDRILRNFSATQEEMWSPFRKCTDNLGVLKMLEKKLQPVGIREQLCIHKQQAFFEAPRI